MDEPARVPTLDGLIGQDRAVGALRAAIESERVHHAWIFAGPRGVGKRTAAEAFAALLLDPTLAPNLAGELEADPDSETRRLIAAGAHPDLHVITKELAAYSDDGKIRNQKQITIAKDVIAKRLLEPISLAPSVRTSARAGKVFVVDEAELLDASMGRATTQNALLKTLEEPPAGSVIVLVTAHEERLLPTVRSRCQRVPFRGLGDDEMEAWRARAGLDVGDERWGWALRFAEGSPGRALEALETGLDAWAGALGPILADLESGRYPVEGGAELAGLMNDWAAGWVTRGEKAGARPSKEAANRRAMRHLVALLSGWSRSWIRDGVGADPGLALRRARTADIITDAERHAASNVNTVFVLDDLLARLAASA
jgi:DNA polymerase-3 subunit delta'